MIPPALLACAPNVAPVTVQAIAQVESGDNPLAVNVNGIGAQPPPAANAQEAVHVAERYIASGYSVDIGLMQVNSRNLAALGSHGGAGARPVPEHPCRGDDPDGRLCGSGAHAR